MAQCREQVEQGSDWWRCLLDFNHVGPHRFDAQYYRIVIARLEGEVAARDAALEIEWRFHHNKICLRRTEGHGDCLYPRPAALSPTGKGCEHEFTGGEGAYPGQWSRCLKCKQMALRPGKAALEVK